MAARKKSESTYVALLRGVNVGGKNKLPMKDLAAMFEAAGCTGVRTFIQSGNVVFDADDRVAARVAEDVEKAIKKRFGHTVPLVIRTRDEVEDAIENNPFPDGDAKTTVVMFLADTPKKSAVAALDPNRSPPDTFVVRGRDVYLHCPNGLARTKLTNAYFDSKLATTSTARNLNTLAKLIALADAERA